MDGHAVVRSLSLMLSCSTGETCTRSPPPYCGRDLISNIICPSLGLPPSWNTFRPSLVIRVTEGYTLLTLPSPAKLPTVSCNHVFGAKGSTSTFEKILLVCTLLFWPKILAPTSAQEELIFSPSLVM